jgi:hypothetical protein
LNALRVLAQVSAAEQIVGPERRQRLPQLVGPARLEWIRAARSTQTFGV